MLRYCLALLVGGYAFHACVSLPPAAWLLPALSSALIGLAIPRWRLFASLLAGFCISWHASVAVIADRLPTQLAGETLAVQGTIAGFPERRGSTLRFVLEARLPDIPRRVRLSWYDAPQSPRVGEIWQLRVRLRPPRGFANPTGFDYEQWLFRQGIGATGYVVASEENRRLDEPVAWRPRLRQRVVDRIVEVCGSNPASAVLQAILVGARHEITAEQWDRYAASGTSHLMAISGLHVGLAAGGAFLLAWGFVAPLCRWRNVRDLAAIVGCATAGAYAMLSGFAVPAQRAFLMTLAVLAAALLRRGRSPDRVLALAALLVFIADPLSILAPGFTLSFAAVAILLWSARQRHFDQAGADNPGQRWLGEIPRRLPPLQMLLLFGLMPLTVALFGRVAWFAPLVNLLVLPFFNLVTVPAGLLGALLDGPLRPVGDALLLLAWHSTRATGWIIGLAVDRAPSPGHVAAATRLVLPAAMLAAVCALLPPGWPGRRLAWLAALAVATARPSTVPRDCVDLTVLDVGQGMSVVMRTARRTVVFDTGPSFLSGGDTGRLVVVPWLRRQGIRQVDLLLVSHGDSDHAGGAASLVSALDVRELMVGERIEGLPRAQTGCRRGQAWLWDGARFSIMHPGTSPVSSDNDGSCVLEVAVGHYRLLLTGDIESTVENRLLENGSLARFDLVLVPHHGSLTSSGTRFVSRVQPDVAIVSAGYDNRWGLPKKEVVRRWEQSGARVLNTATSGAIDYRMCAADGLEPRGEHRIDTRRHWNPPPGDEEK